MPKFSIIVPIYNMEQYIKKCVESVLEQNYTDYELILVDDGSKDRSKLICKKYARQDQRIKIIDQNNQGASVARNNGIKMAIGEYIIFLDADDYWLNNTVLNEINERLTKVPSDVLSFNFRKIYLNGVEKSYFRNISDMPEGLLGIDSLEKLIENDLWVSCPWNKVIRRNLFIKKCLLFEPGVTAEDIEWCVHLALDANNFDYISLEVVAYLQRNESVSKSITEEKVGCLIRNIEKSIALIENRNDRKKVLLKTYVSYQVGTLLATIAQVEERKKRKKLIGKILHILSYLQYSHNKKIVLLRNVQKIIGIDMTVELLRLKEKL